MLSSAVGGVVAANDVRRLDHDAELCQLARTSAPLVAPQKRTCWTITHAGAPPPSGDNLLRHHEPFYLVAHSAGPEPLHLMSERYTLTNAAYSESVRGGERKNLAAATTAPGSRRALWEVVFLDPRREATAVLEPESAPVPANAFVALRHVATQEHLSTDSRTERSEHGSEFSVNLFTDAPVLKKFLGKRNTGALGASNHFAFTTGPAVE